MPRLSQALSTVTNKPYRHADLANLPPYFNDDGYVEFVEDDVENPRNWSKGRRVLITMALLLLSVNLTMSSSAPSGCLKSIAASFDVSKEASQLVTSLFLFGYAAGPLMFGPLSEFYGRRWVLFCSFFLFICFTFLCAFAPTFSALLVGRLFQGLFAAAPVGNIPGMLADMWDPLQRVSAMAWFMCTLWVGAAIGPVMAGFLELKKNWQWIFYVSLWLQSVSAVMMLTIPETYAPTILHQKARRLRAAAEATTASDKDPVKEIKAKIEDQNRTLMGLYRVALTRPWVILFDLISFLCAIYVAAVYFCLYMLFEIYPIVFQEKRGWNAGVGELPLLGTIVGAVVGSLLVMLETRVRHWKIYRGTPEDQLPVAMVGGIGLTICMFWFAWTGQYNSVHWILPTLAGTFLTTGMLLIFVGYFNYLVDTYELYAASALAANSVARYILAGVGPLCTPQMFGAMGVGGGGSLIGGVFALLAVIPFVFYRYGERIRAKSKFATSM